MKLPPFASPSLGLFLLVLGYLVAVSAQSPSENTTDTAITPTPTPPPSSPPGFGETPAFAPNQSVGGMAYGLYAQQFFIQGGNKSDGTASIDFYILHLNVRWNTSSPVWSSLPSNGMTVSGVSGVSGGFLSSGAFVVHSDSPQGMFSYSMPSQTWTKLINPAGGANGGPQVVTATTDNRTYFLTDGFSVDSQGANPTLVNSKQKLGAGSAAVWSPRLGKVISVGTNSTGAFDIRTLDLSSAGSIWTSLVNICTRRFMH